MLVDRENDRIQNQTSFYQIRVKSVLDHQCSDWFEGFSITIDEEGNTLLTGMITDQAALHGLLRKLRDLGLTLMSIVQME